jgi:hypothetical protein
MEFLNEIFFYSFLTILYMSNKLEKTLLLTFVILMVGILSVVLINNQIVETEAKPVPKTEKATLVATIDASQVGLKNALDNYTFMFSYENYISKPKHAESKTGEKTIQIKWNVQRSGLQQGDNFTIIALGSPFYEDIVKSGIIVKEQVNKNKYNLIGKTEPFILKEIAK